MPRGQARSDWQRFPTRQGPDDCHGAEYAPGFTQGHAGSWPTGSKSLGRWNISPTHSGTDGWATQVSAEGIPTLVVGIPLRYMHMPVEVVAIKDIQRAGRLLAEFISGLGPDFMEKMIWE